MGCQTAIAEKKAHYVLSVKERMKTIINCLKKLSGKTMSSGYGYQLKKHFKE
jgi:hypothetical protein